MGRKTAIHRAGDGWRFRWRGKPFWRKDRRALENILARLESDAQHQRGERPLTLASLIERWEHENDPSEWQRSMLDEFDAFAGVTALAEIDPKILEHYHRTLKRRGLSAETCRHKVFLAKRVLQYAVDQAWLDRLPPCPKLPKGVQKPKAVTLDKLQEVFADLAAKSRCKFAAPLARFIVEAGVRPVEARLLTWEQVDWEHASLVIPAHKTAKRTHEARIVTLNKDALRILKDQRDAKRSEQWVFPSRLGKPFTRDGFGDILERRGITQYQLRHCFAQNEIDQGTPPEIVTAMLGHKTSSMVWTYARIKAERVRQFADKHRSPLKIKKKKA